MVYAKPPFGGPAAVLAYLARYTHRTAIANSRLVSMDDHAIRFRCKDYRSADPTTGAVRLKTMSLTPDEFRAASYRLAKRKSPGRPPQRRPALSSSHSM